MGEGESGEEGDGRGGSGFGSGAPGLLVETGEINYGRVLRLHAESDNTAYHLGLFYKGDEVR